MATTSRKTVKLLHQLHKNTEEGKLAWQKTLDDGVFQVGFPNYAIKIRRRLNANDQSAFDYIILLLDIEGDIVEEIVDTDFTEDPEFSGGEAYMIMGELYSMARRIGMGVDKALDSILSELSD